MNRSGNWAEWATRELAGVRAAGRFRAPRDFDAAGPEGKLAPDGRPVVSFASNDYLGLTQHPAVVAAAHAALDRWGAGAGSARLIVGSRPVHSELEAALAEWKAMPGAALFPTGFATNLGVLTAFAGPGVMVCSDELNHASIIDGCRVALCRGAGALLVVDEAHAVLGPEPAGEGVEMLRIGTLSKTLGALGGFVAGPRPLVDLVVNRARSYIFTTAPTPADAAASLASLRVLRSPEGDHLIARLRDHVERLRPGHPSPILAVLCGDEASALDASAALLERGLLVPAIRPPTVPVGTSRLRIALSAAHTDEQIGMLARGLDDLGLS